MSDWVATTKTGTTYRYCDGVMLITSGRDGSYAIKPHELQAARTPTVLPWQDGSSWQPTDRPRVGERLYVGGLRDWRISTEIVSVEELRP
jgi:hypothetical protein